MSKDIYDKIVYGENKRFLLIERVTPKILKRRRKVVVDFIINDVLENYIKEISKKNV